VRGTVSHLFREKQESLEELSMGQLPFLRGLWKVALRKKPTASLSYPKPHNVDIKTKRLQ
jgi:hypothetical protein